MYNGEYKELTGLMIFLLRLWKGDQEYIPRHPECRKKLPSLLSKDGTYCQRRHFSCKAHGLCVVAAFLSLFFEPSVVLAL